MRGIAIVHSHWHHLKQPSTLKRWELSLHLCSQNVRDVSVMKDESCKVSVTIHKEKMPARNQSDAADRETLRERCLQPASNH